MDNRARRTLLFTGGAIVALLYILLAVHSEYWLGIVTTHPIGDDYKIYYGAYIKALAGENPYEPYGIGSGYIYHPAALYFVSLLAWEGQWISTWVWIVTSAIAWGVSLWLALLLVQYVWHGHHLTTRRKYLIIGLFAAFAPFWETLHIGQNNAFVCLGLLLTLYFIQRDRHFGAGVSLAVAIVLKTSPVLLLAWLVVTQKYRALFWTLLILAVLSVFAVIQFSPIIFLQYWETLPRLGAELHPDTYNQSVLSVIYQTFPVLAERQLDSTLVLVYRAISAAVSGVLLVIAFLDYLKTRRVNVWLYTAIIVTFVLFSPLVWYHHSTLLLLPFTLLLASPHRAVFISGLCLIIVLQAERLFEQHITLTAYPVVFVHLALLGIVCSLYFKTQPAKQVASERIAA
jgi:hypothetical protein